MAPSLTNAGETVLPPARLAHFVLKTSPASFPTMVKFYKTFLNAKDNYENDSISFLTYDEEHHRLGIVARPNVGPLDENAAGLVHTAYGFNTIYDLALAYRQRKNNGILPNYCVNHGPTTSLYYLDPDGNEIETFVDNLGVEEARASMETERFAANPMGIYFDPEDLIKRLEAGEDEESIKDQANMENVAGRHFVSAH